MLRLIGTFIFVAGITWLLCLFFGGLIASAGGPSFITFIGKFLEQYAVFIAVICGIGAVIGSLNIPWPFGPKGA